MNNFRKRAISVILIVPLLAAFIGLLAGCMAESSEKIPIPTPTNGFVYDEGNLLSDSLEEKLNHLLVDLEEKTEIEFAIISIPSLLNRSIEEYANNLFNTLGIGKKGKDNGILLLISRSDMRVRLEVGRGLEECLNDAKCGAILDDYFVPYREKDDYETATNYTVQATISILADYYEFSIEGIEQGIIRSSENEETSSTSFENLHPLAKIVIILVIVLLILALIAMFVASSDGDDSSSSGGFLGGGFGGGGSSGGFGGGFSGGAGASR